MTSMLICFVLLDSSRMNPMDSMEPTNAPAISVMDPAAVPRLSRKIISSATVSLAPDEMPNTKGPAMGFAKKV